MRYLIGDLSSVNYADLNAEVVEEITREHLGKAKKDNDYWVIDLIGRKYFHAETNSWKPFKTK